MSSLVLHPGPGRVRLPPGAESAAQEPTILPTLFGQGYGLYELHKGNFLVSFLAHTFAVILIATSSSYLVSHRREVKQQIVQVVTDISPYIMRPSKTKSGGGGGGGDRDVLAASKGTLPKFAMQQLAPPTVIVRNEHPKLPVEPTVVVPPDIRLSLPQTSQLGDPLSSVLSPLSNGTGSGGGIGSGSGGGVGSGNGPGVGPGSGGGIGGGVFRVGGGVSAPRVIYAPDPEFSEEARKAKYQGTVVLWAIVGTDGRVHDIRISRSLGMGLDEKAIAALREWRFEPSRRDGIPVAVQIDVQVSFRLY